jgi:hypothetical protein
MSPLGLAHAAAPTAPPTQPDTVASTTRSGPARPRGLARRVLDGLVVAVLSGLGALGTVVGTGLSLIGFCCAGPALAAGGVAAAGAGAAGAAGGAGAQAWPFLATGVVLLAAAALLARRQTRGSHLATAGAPRRPRPPGR